MTLDPRAGAPSGPVTAPVGPDDPPAPGRWRRLIRSALSGVAGVAVAVLAIDVVGGTLIRWYGAEVVESYTVEDHDYRVRAAYDLRRGDCVQVDSKRNRGGSRKWGWMETACAWPPVHRGDGWLAGGVVVKLYTETGDRNVGDWVFAGVVPAGTAEVQLALSTGEDLRIRTRRVGTFDNPVYAALKENLGEQVTVTGTRLFDGSGGELRVF